MDMNNNVSRMLPGGASGRGPPAGTGPVRPRRAGARPAQPAAPSASPGAASRRAPMMAAIGTRATAHGSPRYAGPAWLAKPGAAPGRRQSRPGRPRSRQELQAPPGPARRQRRGAARRGGRPARPERRRQDHLLLHHHRADRGRHRQRSSSTARTSPTCRCIAAPGSASAICRRKPSIFRGLTVEQNIRAILEVAEPEPDTREAMLDGAAWRSSRSAICGAPRRSRCRAASGAASRSPGRSRPRRISSCSTSRWPASIRSRSATSATWWRT